MTNIAFFLKNTPFIYGLVSVVNELLVVAGCAILCASLWRIRPRLAPGRLIASAALAVGAGLTRAFLSMGTPGENLIWSTVVFIAPFLCVMLLYEKKHVWKAVVAVAGYTFVEAVKYVILVMAYSYDSENRDDPLELAVEFVIDAAFFLLAILFFLLFARRRSSPFAVTRISPALILTLCLTTGVFIATLALFANRFANGHRTEFAFILLNVPLLALSVILVAVTLARSNIREESYRNRMEMQIRHYEMMEQLNEEMRIFRHDLPKKLRPLTAHLEEGNPEMAREIAEQLEGTVERTGARFHTGNARLDTVLFCEDQIASRDGNRIEWTFGSVFPAEGIDPDDVYTIFPNALDNAIEACRGAAKSCVIEVGSRIIGDTVYVTIRNPVKDAPRFRGDLPVTTKRDAESHGFGLRSIRRAASKYGTADIRVEDGVFELRLSLRFA